MNKSLLKLSIVSATLALTLSPMVLAVGSETTSATQLKCFSGTTDGGYNGTCEITKNGAVLNTVDSDEDAGNAYAGVYYEQAGLGGKLLSEADALSFSYEGSGAAGGSPRFSIPIDENNDGNAENYAFIDTTGCNDGDANTGTLDAVKDQTCTVAYGGVTYENWASFATANPDYRFARDSVVFVIADQPGQFTLNNVKIGSQGSISQKELCKENGWRTMSNVNGQVFKNQGACVSYHVNSTNSKVKRVEANAQKQLKN